VLLVSVGALAGEVLDAARTVERAGYSVRVVDPRWVAPLDPQLLTLAERAALVVTVEDGVVTGGVGVRLSQLVRTAGLDVATREIGIPDEFLDHGKVPDVRLRIGLTSPDIARRVVEWAAAVRFGSVLPTP
jgi:1-deoxy-D-xylulose-5-phosphate synthase